MTSETSVDRANQLQELTERAQTACATTGAASSECIDAWTAVKAAQSESSNPQTDKRSSLDRYCANSPDAAECRIYDV